jgi:hypothetical protein
LPIFSIASNAAGRADTGLGLRRDWVGASDPTFTPGDRVTAALNAAMGRRTATAEQFLPWEGVRITEPAHSVASTMSVTANEPLTLRGEASVHEGTVQWRVTNSTREVVASGVTSASVGAPGRGTLEFTIKGAAGRPLHDQGLLVVDGGGTGRPRRRHGGHHRGVTTDVAQRQRAMALSTARAAGPALLERRTVVPRRAGVAPAAMSVSTSVGEMPPSGPTMTSTSPSAGRVAAASAVVASSCSTYAVAPVAIRCASCAVVTVSPRRGRREEDLVPLAAGLLAALTAPLDDAAVGLPGHDLVDAELGRGLDRLVVAVVLGEGLDEDEPGPRLGHRRDLVDPQRQLVAAGRLDDPDDKRALAVGQLQPLARGRPANRHGVTRLRASKRDHSPDHGVGQPTRGGEVERERHRGIPRRLW